MMKIAISGVEAPYLNASITVLLEDAQRMGVQWIELIYPQNVETEGLERSLALITESGIGVAAVTSWSHLLGSKDTIAQQKMLLEAIEIAERMGAALANTYFGHAEKRNDDALIALYMQRLAPCLERATELGVTIVVENECDVFGLDPEGSDITRRPESLRALMERVNSRNFGVCFDATNAYAAGLEPYPLAYNILADHIRYVHVKDGALYRPQFYPDAEDIWSDHGEQYTPVILGEGGVNQDGLLRRLKADGYDGFLGLEPHLPVARHHEGLAATLRYLREGGFGE